MIMVLICVVIQSAVGFYKEGKQHMVYEGLSNMQTVKEFYIYQAMKEIGEEWDND